MVRTSPTASPFSLVTTFNDFLSLKNGVNEPSKSNKQRNFEKNSFSNFQLALKVKAENCRIRIRIRTNMPRIRIPQHCFYDSLSCRFLKFEYQSGYGKLCGDLCGLCQSCLSGSVGSICFWASRIRIRIHYSEIRIRILLS